MSRVARFARRRLTYANVMSTVAVLLATTGTAYAILISGSQVVNGSLTGLDVRNGSLGGADIATASIRGSDVAGLSAADIPNKIALPLRNLPPTVVDVDVASQAIRTVGPLTFHTYCVTDINNPPNVITGVRIESAADNLMVGNDGDLDIGESYLEVFSVPPGSASSRVVNATLPGGMFSVIIQGGILVQGMTPACSTAGIVVQGGLIIQGGLNTRSIVVEGG